MRLKAVSLAVLLAMAFAQNLVAVADTEFHDAQLTRQVGSKSTQDNVILVYGDDAFAVWPDKRPKDQKEPLISFKYADIESGEYTFGKSPRVAAALLVSPLFLFSSSKSHWLTVKAKAGDYALLRLDKSNYKLVIAELEKRAHITVQSIGENK